MTLSRRKFLFAATGSFVSLYVGGWWIFKVRENDATDFISAALKSRLDFLNLDEAGVKQFAIDYQDTKDESMRDNASWAGMIGFVYQYVNIFKITPLYGSIQAIEEDIELLFLMSSDFFIFDADESRTVHYLGLYGPYLRPCSNPLVKD